MPIDQSNLAGLGSLAFEFLSSLRSGENPDIKNYLDRILTQEDKEAFLALVNSDEQIAV